MKHAALALATVLALSACSATHRPGPTPGADGFDASASVPARWRAASTGGDGPDATWSVRADAAAVSAPNVLALTQTNHDDEDRFNLVWSDAHSFRDGRISVAVRADDGRVDQGGGLAWRVRDARNYYVCRVNPLESNYRVYVVKDGVRRQLATALCAVETGTWHRLEVEHVGDRITCWLDGRKLLEARDATLTEPGGVGLWTKADARTSFDDLVGG